MSQVLVHVLNTNGVDQPGKEKAFPVTTYEDFPFNSFAVINGKYYGANSDGLFEIDTGTLDDTASIDWTFTTGQNDFGSPQMKRLDNFYIAMRSDGDVTLEVGTDENPTYSYPLTPLSISTLKQRRSLLGKGMRGRYWQFTLSGSDNFDFDAYMAEVFDMSRRV